MSNKKENTPPTEAELMEKYSALTQEELIAHAVKAELGLEGIHADYLKTIGELKEKIKELGSGSQAKKIVVSHSKKKYRVTAPSFRYKGVTYKAEELEESPQVIKALIEMESSILVEDDE